MNGLDSEEFEAEILLIAENDGSNYYQKDTEKAIADSFKDFQARRRQEERIEFNLARLQLQEKLRRKWEA